VSGAEEYLEVVDADERVIGLAPRSEIHRRGLMHRSAHVLLMNRRGEVFLQQRAESKDECPGLWDSAAAGHVDPGESYAQCAERELAEELGVTVAGELQYLGVLPASRETAFEHSAVFLYRHDGPLRLDPVEVAGGAWLDPAALQRRVEADDATLTPTLRVIWRAFAGACCEAQGSGGSPGMQA